MAVSNPDRIVIIEMHIDLQFPLGLPEARARWFTYPPPYKSGNSWSYVTPWIWYDGNPHCYDFDPPTGFLAWDSLLAERMNVPSPITITMWGTYNSASGTGTINAQFRNDSTVALMGHVLFVITEDSVNYPGPNGDTWHNQVARDYIPDTIGSLHSIPAGESLTVSQPFTIDPTWNAAKTKIVVFIQDTLMQPDSVIEIWQGARIDLEELGISEYGSAEVAGVTITPAPNPCFEGTRFAFTLPAGEPYQITVFDVTGRKITVIDGIASGSEQRIVWNLRDVNGVRVSSGVYFYRFLSEQANATGKVVVR